MTELLLISAAAFFAGGLNAMAGGGSFLTFPALIFIGIPPIAANATSGVAVFPGYLSGAYGFRNELQAFDRKELVGLVLLAIIGGVLGALLLLVTSPELFSFVVPWLLLFATLLFAFDKQIRKWAFADRPMSKGAKISASLAVSTYGGYFNGGLGIVLLALFSSLGYRDINLMNGLKNGLSFILSAASVVTFSIAGIVHWKEAGIMMIFAIIGGYVGALIARKLPTNLIRLLVIAVGLIMTVVFFAR